MQRALSQSVVKPAGAFFLRTVWSNPAVIVWAGLVLRLLIMTLGHTYRFQRVQENFPFGWETGRIARSIAIGEGFSSPFTIHYTGPTAWIAPFYPYLLAAVFKVFGVYTYASSWVVLAINSVFSALNALAIYHIARRCFGDKAALWSAWIWALLPYAMYYAIHWAWETSLAALLLSCVFLLSLRMAGIGESNDGIRPRIRDWLLFGLLWGLIALVNPSLLLWLLFAGIWLLVKQVRHRAAKTAFLGAFLSGLVFLALLAPWTARNYRVFHKLLPVRGNFGAELRMGNADDAEGLWRSYVHPTQYDVQLHLYERMGEVAYVKMRKQEALSFIHAHPGRFLDLCLRRAVYFWFDTPMTNWAGHLRLYRNILFFFTSVVAIGGAAVMLRRRHPAGFLYASLLFAAPLVYYITFPHPRYRHPIEPQITILGVYLFQAASRKKPGAERITFHAHMPKGLQQ